MQVEDSLCGQSRICQRPQSKDSNFSRISLSPQSPQRRRKYVSVAKKKQLNKQHVSLSPQKQSSDFRNSPIHRVSYSPDTHRKHLYWQNWLLPSNLATQSCIELPPVVTAKSYCAILSDSDQIIVGENYTKQMQVASLTKIMTAYTVVSICNTYGVKVRDYSIKIHRQAALMQGTSANLHVDDEVLIIDLLYALLLPSGNDAAVALAQYFGKFLSFKLVNDEYCYKKKDTIKRFEQFNEFYNKQYQKDSIKLFVFQMNKNCHKIGLSKTHFANPTGLNNSKNYSTAKDMAILTSHCLKNHLLRNIFRKKIHTCDVKNQKLAIIKQLQWKNTNRHLFQFRQCIGIKTGITPNAGPCLSSAYKVLNRQIVIIVLKCSNSDERFNDAENVYRYCRKKIQPF